MEPPQLRWGYAGSYGLVQFQATCSGISATSTVSSCDAPNLQSQICNLQSH